MSNLPLYLLLPLAAAFIYAVASMLLKKALVEGAHPMACFHINNWAGMFAFVTMAFFETRPVPWSLVFVPVAVGIMFFVGSWFTFVAMQRGDVSLVTPVLGSKVVFVALATSLLIANGMSALMWLAAILTTGGIFMMSATDIKTPRGARLAGPVTMALVSASFFALADVVMQKYAPTFGGRMFLAVMSSTNGLLSGAVMLIGYNRPPMPWNRATAWSVGGSILVASQSFLMGLALAFHSDAIGVNVVYATRGLFSLMVVALLGPLIGNRERHESGRVYGIRVFAAVLLLVGVVIAVIGRTR